MELWVGAFHLGLIYAFVGIGIFISFKILDFADITADASFTTGGAVTAICLINQVHPLFALVFAFLGGSVAGFCTSLIHTKMKINALLSGILVMIGFYSINLRIMGRSNLPLLKEKTLFTIFKALNPGMNQELWIAALLLGVIAFFILLMTLFFKTDLGLTIRSTGDNSVMSKANGVNVDFIKILSISMANGIIAFSGSLFAQYQGFADINMGIGTIVMGLAAIIVGESIIKGRTMAVKLSATTAGSMIFRYMIVFALVAGMDPIDLKLITSLFVLVTLFLSKSVKWERPKRFPIKKKTAAYIGAVLILIITGVSIVFWPKNMEDDDKSEIKVGIVQVVDNPILNITRDAFVEEMFKLGYSDSSFFSFRNANDDRGALSSIVDQFKRDDVNVILSISTPATQAVVNKVKDIPVVFATVANPFVLDVGENDSVHAENVTGIYGWAPMGKTMELLKDILPDTKKVGTFYNPSDANSNFYLDLLRNITKEHDGLELVEGTITNSSEVAQAAMSVISRGAEAFLLPPDNTVYSSFEAIVQEADKSRVPIFLSDVERLKDGAFAALGYEYSISGRMAAHVVKDILNGKSPADIPFQKYKKLTVGFNLRTAEALEISIPDSILKKATQLVMKDGSVKGFAEKPDKKERKKLALFQFNDHTMIDIVAKRILRYYEEEGIIDRFNLEIDRKNAQNEYATAFSIAQQMVRDKYDYIITLSTPALQVTAQANKTIPHVFGAVTDPYRMGVAKNPREHQKNLTGVATFQPVRSSFRLMREIFPKGKKVGIIWNPAEACSEACTMAARKAAEEFDFQLIEVTVNATTEVIDALNSLFNHQVDVVFSSGDNTVLLALESVASRCREKKKPYFTNTFSDVERGAFVSIGADYAEVGVETAKMMIKVMEGTAPAEIPIYDFVPEKVYLNMEFADEYGITIPKTVIEKAAKIRRRK